MSVAVFFSFNRKQQVISAIIPMCLVRGAAHPDIFCGIFFCIGTGPGGVPLMALRGSQHWAEVRKPAWTGSAFGCPDGESGRVLGTRYVLGDERSVAWARVARVLLRGPPKPHLDPKGRF